MTKPKRTRSRLDFIGDGMWLSVADAAKMKGVSPKTIRNALEDGRIINKQHVRIEGSQRMVLMVLMGELDGVRFRECKQPKRGKR